MTAPNAIAKFEAEADQLAQYLEAIQVVDAESYSDAAATLVDVKTARKAIETERTKVTKPQNDALKATNAFFRGIDAKYAAVEADLKAKMGAYFDEQRRQEAKLIAAASTAETHALDLVAEAAPAAQGVQMRSKKCWRLVDIKAVPAEFWMLDEKLIGSVIRSGESIPGIEVYEETVVAAGTR